MNAKYSYEELLELTREILHQQIYSLNKKLIFMGSSFDTFSSCFEAYFNPINVSDQYEFIIFSPFLYFESYYNDSNISTDSSLWYFYDKISESNLIDRCRIHYFQVE